MAKIGNLQYVEVYGSHKDRDVVVGMYNVELLFLVLLQGKYNK